MKKQLILPLILAMVASLFTVSVSANSGKTIEGRSTMTAYFLPDPNPSKPEPSQPPPPDPKPTEPDKPDSELTDPYTPNPETPDPDNTKPLEDLPDSGKPPSNPSDPDPSAPDPSLPPPSVGGVEQDSGGRDQDSGGSDKPDLDFFKNRETPGETMPAQAYIGQESPTVSIVDPSIPLQTLGQLPKTGGNSLFPTLFMLAGICFLMAAWMLAEKSADET